jgi:hypothetical protein
MANDWSVSARDELVRLREGEMAWGERSGAPPRVEPTALACLGLLAGGLGGSSKTPGDIVLRAADWLATVQLPDGALGLSATIPAPNWTTPFGILVWAALPKYAGAAQRAGQSLVQQKGAVFEDHMKIFGHDPSIVGWTWLEGEHSWLEPTALAVMALRRLGLGARREGGITGTTRPSTACLRPRRHPPDLRCWPWRGRASPRRSKIGRSGIWKPPFRISGRRGRCAGGSWA